MTEYEKYCARRGDLTTDDFYPPEAYPPELAPCPFCGNVCRRTDESGRINLKSVRVEVKTVNPLGIQPQTVYYVLCRQCYGRSGNAPTAAEAVRRWSMRVGANSAAGIG